MENQILSHGCPMLGSWKLQLSPVRYLYHGEAHGGELIESENFLTFYCKTKWKAQARKQRHSQISQKTRTVRGWQEKLSTGEEIFLNETRAHQILPGSASCKSTEPVKFAQVITMGTYWFLHPSDSAWEICCYVIKHRSLSWSVLCSASHPHAL